MPESSEDLPPDPPSAAHLPDDNAPSSLSSIMGSSRSMSCTCKIQCCNCVLVQDIETMNQTNHLSWRNLPIPIFISELDYIICQFHKQQPVKIGKGHLLNMNNNLLFDCAWAWNTRQFVMSFYTTHPHWITYMFNDLKDACLATCSIHWLSCSDQVLTYDLFLVRIS